MRNVPKLLAAVTLMLAWCGGASAQSFPSRSATLVVAFTPGGPSDVISRIVGRSAAQTYDGALDDRHVGFDVVETKAG